MSNSQIYKPSELELQQISKILNSPPCDSLAIIREASLEVLTAKFLELMSKLESHRRSYFLIYGRDPLESYSKNSFSSKEEFLAYTGQVSSWLFDCDLPGLDSVQAMKLVSKLFGVEYGFFCQFDYKD